MAVCNGARGHAIGVDLAAEPFGQAVADLRDGLVVDPEAPDLRAFGEWAVLRAEEDFVFEDGDGEGVGDLLAVGEEGPGLTGVAADTQADGRGCREKTGQRGVSADFVNVP